MRVALVLALLLQLGAALEPPPPPPPPEPPAPPSVRSRPSRSCGARSPPAAVLLLRCWRDRKSQEAAARAALHAPCMPLFITLVAATARPAATAALTPGAALATAAAASTATGPLLPPVLLCCVVPACRDGHLLRAT